MGREQQYVELGELAARRLREQLDHFADAVRLHQVLAYRQIICRKSSMRFIAWIRLKPMAWVSDYSWFDGQRICSAIASGSDPQSGTDHVFRSCPEQDGQQIGLPRSRSKTGLGRCRAA
jgi:hypothetical protein